MATTQKVWMCACVCVPKQRDPDAQKAKAASSFRVAIALIADIMFSSSARLIFYTARPAPAPLGDGALRPGQVDQSVDAEGDEGQDDEQHDDDDGDDVVFFGHGGGLSEAWRGMLVCRYLGMLLVLGISSCCRLLLAAAITIRTVTATAKFVGWQQLEKTSPNLTAWRSKRQDKTNNVSFRFGLEQEQDKGSKEEQETRRTEWVRKVQILLVAPPSCSSK
ncbi:hypothetical protein F5Y05DRAFT_244430 [Hypoxylon sp. FL0543]|nr:hypothetical protein F5Y05DRAFT_244430 [Hypoxylon sp. FL0543]